jgi:hypothetical protein
MEDLFLDLSPLSETFTLLLFCFDFLNFSIRFLINSWLFSIYLRVELLFYCRDFLNLKYRFIS